MTQPPQFLRRNLNQTLETMINIQINNSSWTDLAFLQIKEFLNEILKENETSQNRTTDEMLKVLYGEEIKRIELLISKVEILGGDS